MKPAEYREHWQALQKAGLNQDALSRLAKRIAGSFMDYFYEYNKYIGEYIDLLCEMAAFSMDPDLKKVVSSAFFNMIIEEICDDYEKFQVELYNRVMSQVITYFRNIPEGKIFDRYLSRFHLHTADELYQRAIRIHSQNNPCRLRPETVKNIFLLSRVTIGADVAIVSVMIQRLAELFPNARMILVGGPRLHEIFGGNPRVYFKNITYVRGSGLMDKLTCWCELIDTLTQETAAEGMDSALVIDSDSRLTQLGVLPVFPQARYFFFNSHSDLLSSENVNMARMANAWIDKVFGRAKFCYPQLWIAPEILNRPLKVIHSLRQNGCRRITVVNFGVGGNARKRLDSEFEKKLITELLKQPKSAVILDMGFGPQELANSQDIIEHVKNNGLRVLRSDLKNSQLENFSQGILALECGIGELSALISGSDEFIGYDSACQHIAAALAVPGITIFAGSNNPQFIRRWSACGNTECRIIHVDTLSHPGRLDLNEIISRVLENRTFQAPKSSIRRKITSVKTTPQKTEIGKIKQKGL